jgi:hypothetical protein
MIRLHIVVEGPTEEAFVNQALVEHLAGFDVFADARSVEVSRDRKRATVYRGGLFDYGRAKRDLTRWMKQDDHPEVHFTTMFDLYALPRSFPAYEEAGRQGDPYRRIEVLERGLGADIGHPRLLPYLQLHEFEALLFADAAKLAGIFVRQEEAISALRQMAEAHSSPELIDDGDDTAPSKRIIHQLPGYAGLKATAGPLVAKAIGLPVLRARCPHFGQWLQNLEGLGGAP